MFGETYGISKRVTIQMYVNEFNPMLFVKDLVAKKGNFFLKRSKNIRSAKVTILKAS